MSRVYRALEKVEEERKQRVEEPPLRVFEEKTAPRKEGPESAFREQKIEKIEKLGLPQKEIAPVLIVQPHSFCAEAFRKLKTQIFLHPGNSPRTILVTSAAPQEGKTLVAVNLAVAISKEIHSNVILVDGDLRRPGIQLEKTKKGKGLSNYLSDGIPLSEILINSEIEKLQIIPAGSSTRKSSELIRSRKMGELLDYLKGFGDHTYIVIDSPPIMATPDPSLLSKMVDGIILVVRAGYTSRESIQDAIKSIDRQKIIGVVFNQIDAKPSAYFSEYYRYYQYYKNKLE
ncbi:MAG TPA: CpsD/CapB family tyrosine-protein kinase [Thermodesulfobacteriota bacterium]|nr:CpsD/CapB family tyrosine-protein kinase [Thermodesulfobacteriota bacterium]